MYFLVVIKDEKSVYGRTRYLVKPVSGEGEAWVDVNNLVANTAKTK